MKKRMPYIIIETPFTGIKIKMRIEKVSPSGKNNNYTKGKTNNQLAKYAKDWLKQMLENYLIGG